MSRRPRSAGRHWHQTATVPPSNSKRLQYPRSKIQSQDWGSSLSCHGSHGMACRAVSCRDQNFCVSFFSLPSVSMFEAGGLCELEACVRFRLIFQGDAYTNQRVCTYSFFCLFPFSDISQTFMARLVYIPRQCSRYALMTLRPTYLTAQYITAASFHCSMFNVARIGP